MRVGRSVTRWLQQKQVELGYHASLGARQRFPPIGNNTVEELRSRSIQQSADYFQDQLPGMSLFGSDLELHTWVNRKLRERDTLGLLVEFGFYTGTSAKRLTDGMPKDGGEPVLYSFDAFRGLRDSWSAVGSSIGAFDLGGIEPESPNGVKLVVGWVEDTLPSWLASHPGTVSFAHFDMDVYPPTRFALEHIAPRLQRGSLLLFDEFHGYPGWKDHEFRALNEVLAPADFRHIAIGPEQCLVEIQ